MYLPPELVREIITRLLDDPGALEETGRANKKNWSSIEVLTLASKMYRTLTLEAWFRTLFVQVPTDIQTTCDMFPEVRKKWARHIHCVQTDSRHTSVWNLQGFECLSKIRLDWLSPSMMPHYGSDDPADRLPFTHVSSLVTELDIRGLPWPSPVVFHNIGGILPALNVLKLHQTKIWCGLCHTCSIARFCAPGPSTLIYEDGTGLPMHYARAFASLTQLHTVSLSIADFGSGKTTLSNNEGENQYLWAGECDRCMEIMYEDDAFRDRWVARKKGYCLEGRENETVYIRPPALKRVEWTFRPAYGEEDPDEPESAEESSGSGEDID